MQYHGFVIVDIKRMKWQRTEMGLGSEAGGCCLLQALAR